MLGRVAAVVIAFIAAAPALPQCNFAPVRSAQFRSTALDLAIDGNDIWVATSYGVSLYDRRVDPPALVASVAVPGITRAIRAQNGIAYAGSGTSIAVIQKSGAHAITVLHLIEGGGTINDMAISGDLYLATSNGIGRFSLLNPQIPVKTSATFTTSRPAVTSLVFVNTFLYAADGDASIEVFDQSGQRVGALTAPSGVNYVRANNGKIYASPGALSTYVFTGTGANMTNVGTGAFGTASVAPLAGDVAFMAGTDRRLHAVDFSVAGTPVDVFRADLPATNGTTNRIAALATAGNRLYVAAGDAGLLSYDTTTFVSPFAIRAYPSGGGTTIVSLVDNVYIARDTGGIAEFKQAANGGLTAGRTWDANHIDSVWDGTSGVLLSSSGASVTVWTLQSSTPQPTIGTATFRAPVVSAVLSGVVAFAVLSDGSLWSADFGASSTPAPKQLLNDKSLSAIARSGSSIVVEQINTDGTTTLFDFATSDLTQPPKSATVPGVAVTGVTLSGSVAAVLTFRGISLIDFASGSTTVLPQSVAIAKSLILNGTTLYELTDTALIVWDTQKQAIVKQYTIPADPTALHVAATSTIADVATSTGIASIATSATSGAPASIAATNPNVYYRRIAGGADRVDLFDGRNADIYANATLRWTNGIKGITDIAANDNGVYTLSNGLVVTSYASDGYLRGSSTINATDARPLTIRAVGSAVWVSVEAGCPVCTQTTYVFDPRSGMMQTASFPGGIIDVVNSGDRAYAVTDSNIRVMNISDPFHPSTIVSAPAAQSAVSIAYANGTVYVLGDKLTSYDESTLTAIAQILGSYVPDPSGVVTPADQRVRIDGNCAVVLGRSFAPQLFTIASASSWAPAASFPMPSATRSLTTQPGVLQFLTDHSLETWSTKPLPAPPRRAAVTR